MEYYSALTDVIADYVITYGRRMAACYFVIYKHNVWTYDKSVNKSESTIQIKYIKAHLNAQENSVHLTKQTIKLKVAYCYALLWLVIH